MLTNEDRERIQTEEAYRQQLRADAPPVNTTSFTDRMNKVFFYVWIVMAIVVLGALTTCVSAMR